MRLLALDTSGTACSVALLLEGQLCQRLVQAPRNHGAQILPLVEGLLAEGGLTLSQLDALAFGRGPGSFTGVRIAAAVVQGLALGAELPVVPVSTLAGLAQGLHRLTRAQRVFPALDARMGELYWGAYALDASAGLMVLQGAEGVAKPDQLLLPAGNGWHGVGSGWTIYGETLERAFGEQLAAVHAEPRECEAQDLAKLAQAAFRAGQAVPPEQALPVYLRNRVTFPPNRAPR